ncbi:hypothetical protein [Phenylobacterium sp.]|uniref:hypothetical protein n=1 Tax=Phenylobacterium sp. TaxID=1871053 RepID=UPI002DF1B6B3|nr:hypothetical protein [Phenylobacterium sp.]
MSEAAHCCFCFGVSPQDEMYFLNVLPLGSVDGERTQQLFCHGACFAKALHPSFPELLDFPDARPAP